MKITTSDSPRNGVPFSETQKGGVYRRIYSDGTVELDDVWLRTDEDSMVALGTGTLYCADLFGPLTFVPVDAEVVIR